MPDNPAKIRVLYAEDEGYLGKIVKESLESRGFEVWMETDGAKVVPAFSKMQPDVCILDIMMPNKDGFEIAEAIRALNETVPILFVTAKSRTEDVVKGFTLGGNDYIRKPFSMDELIVRIHNTFRNREKEAPPSATETAAIGQYLFRPNRQTLALG
jgi:DNA-binding response OmpR family regulator